MLTNTIFETVIAGYTIKLQHCDGVFTVCYGESFKNCHSYEAAAQELGECIMHALNCEGALEC